MKSRLEEIGYEVYVAKIAQSLEDLTEGIFRNINDSEYYIFIDFKRELCDNGEKKFYRGSLFTNQELALAKLLDLKVIPFQEDGIEREGIASFIGLNPTIFSDRTSIIDKVIAQVKKEWRPNWKNQLRLERSKTEYVRAAHIPLQRWGRWYHVTVLNLNKEKMAHQCAGYLEKVVNVETLIDLTPENLVEFKWRDVTTATVPIPPNKSRHLDAFYVFEDQPLIVYPAVNPFIADSTEVLFTLRGPAKYELTYVVFSDDFQPARETFILEMDNDINVMRFYRKGQPPSPTPISTAPSKASVVTSTTSGALH
ncbi:MAG: hypothetical protein ACRECH_13615 [Nitrososphaerales archaeon]